ADAGVLQSHRGPGGGSGVGGPPRQGDVEVPGAQGARGELDSGAECGAASQRRRAAASIAVFVSESNDRAKRPSIRRSRFTAPPARRRECRRSVLRAWAATTTAPADP